MFGAGRERDSQVHRDGRRESCRTREQKGVVEASATCARPELLCTSTVLTSTCTILVSVAAATVHVPKAVGSATRLGTTATGALPS